MKNKIASLALFLTLASCSQVSETDHSYGEIVSSTDTQTFQAKYYGKGNLHLGDRVRILEIEDTDTSLKLKKSRNMPFSTKQSKKKIIDHATISTVLEDNYYELKSDHAKHVPAEAVIEKI